MAGKDIGFPKLHGELTCFGMELCTGLGLGQKALENLAVAMYTAKAVKDFPVLIQNLYRETGTLVKGFQKLMESLLGNDGV